MTDTALTIHQGYLPSTIGSASSVLAEEMDGYDIKWQVLKIPPGGVTTFDMPEGIALADPRKLPCVVVHHHRSNALFPPSADGGPVAPICLSLNGQTGIGERGIMPNGKSDEYGSHSCTTCPWNQFGTARTTDGRAGRGKLCSNKAFLYLAIKGSNLPFLFRLPATSIPEWAKYVQSTSSSGVWLHSVVTEITLVAKKSAAGQPFSVANFRRLGDLDQAESQQAATMREQLRADIRAKSSGAADVSEFGFDEDDRAA